MDVLILILIIIVVLIIALGMTILRNDKQIKENFVSLKTLDKVRTGGILPSCYDLVSCNWTKNMMYMIPFFGQFLSYIHI